MGVEAPDATGLKTLWVERQSNTNKLISMTINDHRGTSGIAPQYPILDLIESEHGYSVDRAAVERITSQQDYRGAYEMLITISSNIFNRIKSSICMKYRCFH